MIYFDNAATTKVDNGVLESFNMAIKEFFANSSSTHLEGFKSANIEKKARLQVANLFSADERDVIFTSGATESNNLAIKGVALKYKNRGKHIITTSIEHLSVLNACKDLEKYGFEVTYINPNENGIVSWESVKKVIRDDTILVSIMAVNNEVGTIEPIEEIAEKLKDYPKIHFHTDATQAIGKIDINYNNVDLISLSGHKIHSFKAAGVLIKRSNTQIEPLFSGGGHQYDMRSGTTNVPGEIALAKALRIAFEKQKERYEYVMTLKMHLIERIKEIPSVIINSNDCCSPFIFSFCCSKKGSVVAEALSNKKIYVSTKSACSSRKNGESYVLRAINKSDWICSNSIRLSFSYENTLHEIDIFIDELKDVISKIK